METHLVSTEDLITPQTGNCEAFGMDYPLASNYSITRLNTLMRLKAEVSSKYKLREPALVVLILIGARWESGQGSTVWALGQVIEKTGLIGTHGKVKRLFEKGLIDVVGRGKSNCKVYAPSRLGMYVLRLLCSV